MRCQNILYSDGMLRYFEENVYGKGEYENAMGQPFDLPKQPETFPGSTQTNDFMKYFDKDLKDF